MVESAIDGGGGGRARSGCGAIDAPLVRKTRRGEVDFINHTCIYDCVKTGKNPPSMGWGLTRSRTVARNFKAGKAEDCFLQATLPLCEDGGEVRRVAS